MKLGEDVLLEIVDIVRKGLVDGVDISDLLRQMDLEEVGQFGASGSSRSLVLSQEYKKKLGRI